MGIRILRIQRGQYHSHLINNRSYSDFTQSDKRIISIIKTLNMKNNTLAIGLLGGLAIGTALGILFAPAKGSETRKKIADKSTDLKDIVVDSSGKLTNKITQTINELKRESQNLIENTTESVKDEIQNFDHLRDINKAIV